MLPGERHFAAPPRPALSPPLSLPLANRNEDLQRVGRTPPKEPNDNRESLSILPVTPRSGWSLLSGLEATRAERVGGSLVVTPCGGGCGP